MTLKDRFTSDADGLRRRADEQISRETGRAVDDAELRGVDRLVHELKVHQAELEMQNEELRLTQRDLDAARARYFDLYDTAPVGYLTFNKNHLIQEANLTASLMLGVLRNTLIKNLMSEFIYAEDQELYYARRQKLVEAGEAQAWDMRLQRRDGTTFWAHLQAVQVYGGEYRIVFSDISELKKMEADKLILEKQFEESQKLESLGVLAGGIAHDFNNILSIITCYCDLIKQQPESVPELIPEIEKAAGRAASLCRQMLCYAGKEQASLAQINMTALVDDMLKMLKATIVQNVDIQADLQENIPSIMADSSQLRQVVMNLVINATEAINDKQGEIRVALANREILAGETEQDHFGKAIPAGNYICLEVTDNGCGMDDETRHHIFEPFYSTKFSGRGLGMPAVLGIITAHRGALQLFSRQDNGTTFKIYLPVQPSVSVKEDRFTACIEKWQGSGTILLAEDEPQIMMVASILLKALGFSVIEATNGKEALELYRKHAEYITLVVTDIGMPLMDGYELIRELNKLDPQLPIVVSSGYGDTVVTSRIAGEGIAGLLSKPYGLDQLRNLLKSVVGKTASKQG